MLKNERGMTLVEVLVSLVLVTVIMFSAVTFMTTSYHTTHNTNKKDFATQKAISILDEMKAFVENTSTVLDNFDEACCQPFLTTQSGVVNPDDPESGNILLDPSGPVWMYERQIVVTKMVAEETRLVNVKIFVNEKQGSGFARHLIAEVASVLSTIASAYSPTHVYDVYLLAVENVPGWWVYMNSMVPFVSNIVQELQARNPGLEFRTHWIRKLSYGRDQEYIPFINEGADSAQPVNSIYFYPGLLPATDAGNYATRPVDFYYVPDLINARINVDGAVRNGYNAGTPGTPPNNQWPYALADNFNNAMRYPDELAYFNARVADQTEDPSEPTYRLLLEDMFQNPADYRNAILVNLHGELFPFPPIRNVSDPAKDPITYPNIRVVTHPEQLRYNNTDDVKLRVYSFRTDPGGATSILNNPITVVLNGIIWDPVANVDIKAIRGGVDLPTGGCSPDPYQEFFPQKNPGVAPNDMYYTTSTSGGNTILNLFNSPLKSPSVAGNIGCGACGSAVGTCGLPINRRLYGMEYVPAPVELIDSGVQFANRFQRNLGWDEVANATAGTARNTARWIITIPHGSGVLPTDSQITIETRINSTTSGVTYPPVSYNAPTNLSRTYTWRGSNDWIFGENGQTPHLPLTERFQIIGDPRHSPYADNKRNFISTTNPLGKGYNRYFDDFHNAAAGNIGNGVNEWFGWGAGVKNAGGIADDDGWDVTEPADPGPQGQLEVDVNRIFQIIRTALLTTNSVYTTLSGFSYFYLGMGNEIGYDAANGFPLGIPVNNQPWNGTNTLRHENSFFFDTGGVEYVKNTANTWFGKYWIGELYEDSQYNAGSNWQTTGNLNYAQNYRRVSRDTLTAGTFNLPQGTTFVAAGRATEEEGCTAFFNIGVSTSTFHHLEAAGTTGDLQTDGTEIANRYAFPLPTTTGISRPFALATNLQGRAPDHFLDFTYLGVKSTTGVQPAATMPAIYYNHPSTSRTGSGLVISKETIGSDTGLDFVVVNGIDKTGEQGTAFIGKWAMLTLIQSFLDGGLNASPLRIRELPRIAITAPTATALNNPSTLPIDWGMTWKRWDDLNYTGDPAYIGFVENTNTWHVVLYSKTSGATWQYAHDDAAATPGVRPTVAARWAFTNSPPATTSYSYNWDVSDPDPVTGFPEGNYLVRVETYRDSATYPLHYSFHQMRIFIKRP